MLPSDSIYCFRKVALPALDARTCFVKGTLVRTPSGFKEIQGIRPGDEVLAWNEKSGELTISRVQQTFVRTTDAIYKVRYEDGTVIETPGPTHFTSRARAG